MVRGNRTGEFIISAGRLINGRLSTTTFLVVIH